MQERIINQSVEMNEASHDTYTLIKELPVKAVAPVLLPRGTSSWTTYICANMLRHWEHVGFVPIYDKEMFMDVIEQSYKQDDKTPKTEELVADIIKEGMFREENGYLVPLKPLLSCATGKDVEPHTAWYCYTQTYSDVVISLTPKS